MISTYKNISLLNYNTFGIDATAALLVEYTEASDLKTIFSTYKDMPFFHIGGGSNILFTRDYDGMILHSRIMGKEIISEDSEEVVIKAGAGENWDDFVAYCVSHNYSGIENLSLIPGEVGASAVQNIGAYGVEAKDVIANVYVYDINDGSFKVIPVDECAYAYRESRFKHEKNFIVTHVEYRLSKKFVPDIAYGNIKSRLNDENNVTLSELRDTVIEIRKEKLPDPAVTGNAGSFFMNPVVSNEVFEKLYEKYPQMPHYIMGNGVKIPAGWLIEQCGWKGKSLGNAGVHKNQALVLINLGGASAQEVVNLSSAIVNDVKEKFGIDIHPEVNFI